MNVLKVASNSTIETLYIDHHAWLQRCILWRLGNAADAADLAQDAFIRLIKTPRYFKSKPEARVYLRTLANGLCVDLWRRRSIEQAWLDTLASQPEALVPSAEHQAMVLETLYEIDTLLQSLAPKAAQAFVLVVACEMTYREVAAELGVSVRMGGKYVAKATLHCLLHATQQGEERASLGNCAASSGAL